MTTSTTDGADLSVRAQSKSNGGPVAPRRLGFVPALDGFRGLAVMLVLIVHLQLLAPYKQTGVAIIDNFIKGGFLGVDLFFVLSGFLITALLLGELGRKGRVGFRSFYVRRGLRLLPALYVFLLADMAYAFGSGSDLGHQLQATIAALLYINNWNLIVSPDSLVPHLTHLWSLAVEEQFYILWPATLVGYLGLRRNAKSVGTVLGLAIFAVAVWRIVLMARGLYWPELIVRTDTRIDSLLVGALLASLWVRRATPTRYVGAAAWLALATLIGCLVVFDGTEDNFYRFGLIIVSVSAATIVLGLVNGGWGGRHFFELRPLRAMGRVSYGVYIWHYPIFFSVGSKGSHLNTGVRIALALVLTTAAVAASWFFVERPALALKARWIAESSRPAIDDGARVLLRPLRWVLVVIVVLGLGWGAGVIGGPAVETKTASTFTPGDVDRSQYWGLAGLETVARDGFGHDRDRLGRADEGGAWTEVEGRWRVDAGTAVNAGGPAGATAVALLPGVDGDNGLSEVTLTKVEPGAGLAFGYRDADNFWSVAVAADGTKFVVDRVVQGERRAVGEIDVNPLDGMTVTAVQTPTSIRVLIDGVDHYTSVQPGEGSVLRGGLIYRGKSGEARWDRFLLMRETPLTPGG